MGSRGTTTRVRYIAVSESLRRAVPTPEHCDVPTKMLQSLLSWWPFCDKAIEDQVESSKKAPLSSACADLGPHGSGLTYMLDEEEDLSRAEWNSLVSSLFGSSESHDRALNFVSMLGSAEVIPPATHLRRIEQLESWDCGVACLLMALHWAKQEVEAEEDTLTTIRRELLQALATKSVWTVDLAWLLHQQIQRHNLPLRFLFSSQALQVNTNLQHFDYYKPFFGTDKDRIDLLFARLRKEQVPMIQQQRLGLNRVLNVLLPSNAIAIALVDNGILLKRDFQCRNNHQYTGHYILLLGLSRDISCLVTSYAVSLIICNPGKSASIFGSCDQEGIHRISLEHFEQAWRASGTDEDILFLVRDDVAL